MRNAVMLHRRRLLTAMALAAAGTSAGTSWARMAAESLAPAAGAKIVIVGAGVGGATAAKYLKIFNPKIHVTLIDRNPNFVRHYGSSELLGAP